MMRRLSKKRLTLAASISAVVACLTVSVGLSASAETLETVKLTPEQTLALFGQTINAQYYDGSAWSSCTFSYYGKSTDYVKDGWGVPADSTYNTYIGQAENTGMSSQEQDTLLRENTFLFYRLDPLDIATSPDNTGHLQFSLDLSLDVSGIKSYRQIFLFSKDRSGSPTLPANQMYYYDTAMIGQPSYASNPIVNGIIPRETADNTNSRIINYISTPYALHSQVPVADGVSPLKYFTMGNLGYAKIDQATGNYTVFSLDAIELNVNNVRPLVFGTSLETAQLGYVFALSTPIVTDGFVIPDTGGSGTNPDYSDILNQNNTLLQQILIKLDAIYDKMGYNPSLTPAQTIPRSLSQYYGGIETAAPSSGSINAGVAGAAVVPFSGILGASGLTATFGLLVGLACAGWVITRGRN